MLSIYLPTYYIIVFISFVFTSWNMNSELWTNLAMKSWNVHMIDVWLHLESWAQVGTSVLQIAWRMFTNTFLFTLFTLQWGRKSLKYVRLITFESIWLTLPNQSRLKNMLVAVSTAFQVTQTKFPGRNDAFLTCCVSWNPEVLFLLVTFLMRPSNSSPFTI